MRDIHVQGSALTSAGPGMLQHVTLDTTYLEVPNTSENMVNMIGPFSMKCTYHVLSVILESLKLIQGGPLSLIPKLKTLL